MQIKKLINPSCLKQYNLPTFSMLNILDTTELIDDKYDKRLNKMRQAKQRRSELIWRAPILKLTC